MTRETPGSCYAAPSSEAQTRPRVRPLSGVDRAGGGAGTSHLRGAGTAVSWPLLVRAPATWPVVSTAVMRPPELKEPCHAWALTSFVSIWDTNINFAHSFNAVVPKANGRYSVIYGCLQSSSDEEGSCEEFFVFLGKYPIKMVPNAFRGSGRKKNKVQCLALNTQ